MGLLGGAMNYFSRSMSAAVMALAISFPVLTCCPTLANGKSGATEYAKYLNPFQKKGYLNKSQDRIIKKKSFKAGSMPETGGQQAANRETGFFTTVPTDKVTDSEFVANLLKDERVSGVSATIPWSQLEPKEDEINWQPIDQLLSLCQQANKTLILRISTAGVDLPGADAKQTLSDTPSWVFDADTKSVTFQSPDGKQHVMPIFWDKSYLAKWSNFVREMATRYDKNPSIHSVGITGGGFAGGTGVLPEYDAKVASTKDKSGFVDLETALKSEYGMNQRQLVEHWKYVADIFPKRFQNARLNFAINPPVPHRYGEDALDEISDYLVYRYGGRVYVTRQNLHNGKHGFDDYRVLLKFRNDTLTGLQLASDTKLDDMAKIVKHALDDGISFAELPPSVMNSSDETVKTALKDFGDHIGYHLVSQQVTFPEKVAVGQPLQASFSFVNVGAAPAIRPERNFDKDTAGSFRLQIELRDGNGKPVLMNVHTPPTPTSQWAPGKPVTWQQELKMIDAEKHQLPPGQYTAWMSLVDTNTKRKIAFVNATSSKTPTSAEIVELGKISIVSGPPVEPAKLEATSQTQTSQGRHDQ
jgi:hypothetical protein